MGHRIVKDWAENDDVSFGVKTFVRVPVTDVAVVIWVAVFVLEIWVVSPRSVPVEN